jgi:hypothetical protein
MARFVSFMIIAWIAAWFGGASFAQLFQGSALFFIGVTCLLVVWLTQILGLFGLRSFSLFFILTFFAFSYYFGTITQYTMSDLNRFTVTENIPVRLERINFTNGDFRGHVRLINESPYMMNHAEVVCQTFWDNGTPFKTFRSGIGSSEVQFPPQASDVTVVVQRSFWTAYRVDQNATECRVTQATFMEPISFIQDIKVTWAPNDRDGRNDFFVTNNSDKPIKNIQFVCVTDKDKTRKVNFLPAYVNDVSQETVIDPGKTVQYIDDEPIWKYKSCVVSNAIVAE